MKIASWNINSVRLRINLLADFVTQEQPDIICLQETKVVDELFPTDAIKKLGFEHVIFRGEKSYNGVAIISKLPLERLDDFNIAGNDDARHIGAMVDGQFELHNFYIPAGGDEPDPEVNPKYKHKLEFLEWMKDWCESEKKQQKPLMIMGDFNIAPGEHDVWSSKQLRKVVSHTEPEITRLRAFQAAYDWVDVARHFINDDEKTYSWWSYRNRDWKKSNRGRRLDHIWVTQPLKEQLASYQALNHIRDWERPSDHVPIVLELSNAR